MKRKRIANAITMLFAAAFAAMVLTFVTGIALMTCENPFETFKNIVSIEFWLFVATGAGCITALSFWEK